MEEEVFKDIVLQSPRYDWSVIEEYNRSHRDQGVSHALALYLFKMYF